jgi:hypothetical protein
MLPEMCSICLLVLSIAFVLRNRWMRSPLYVSQASDIREVLDPRNRDTRELLWSRARANERLSRAIGIRSTFVSDDTSIHKHFVQSSLSLLHSTKMGQWRAFHEIARLVVTDSLSAHQQKIHLDDFIATSTFLFIAVGLLGADIATIATVDVRNITRKIRDHWESSKYPSSRPLPSSVHDDLRRIIPDHQHFPNPIDIVVPTWETLWQLVAAAFVYARKDVAIQMAFADFADNPTNGSYSDNHRRGPCVKFVMEEALRLHPPVRRISRVERVVPFPLNHLPDAIARRINSYLTFEKVVKVDVEAVQRSAVWGDDAHRFDPMRHHPSRLLEEQKQTLMAFGQGKLKCVAREWAPIAAAVITAVLLDEVQSPKFDVEAGQQIGGRTGWEGWYVRRVGA